MDKLEYAFDTIDWNTFEKFSMAFLREEGYEVRESGAAGPDGGWDGRVRLGDIEGIAHASTAENWRSKLRSDATKVENLETEMDESYDIFVFLTNQEVGGEQQLEIEKEIQNEFGWRLKLHHRREILGKLRQQHQELARGFLDIDLGVANEHLNEIKKFANQKLEDISNREGYANDLTDGPTLVLQIIPNAIFSSPTNSNPNEIPEPRVVFEKKPQYSEKHGKYTKFYGSGASGDKMNSYAVLTNDGYYESASTPYKYYGSSPSSAFIEKKNEIWLQGHPYNNLGLGLDAGIILTTKSTLNRLSDMGFSGTAFIRISLFEVHDVKLSVQLDEFKHFGLNPPQFDKSQYSTEFVNISVQGEKLIERLQPILSEIWIEFTESPTPCIKNGEWAVQPAKLRDGPSLETGDKK